MLIELIYLIFICLFNYLFCVCLYVYIIYTYRVHIHYVHFLVRVFVQNIVTVHPEPARGLQAARAGRDALETSVPRLEAAASAASDRVASLERELAATASRLSAAEQRAAALQEQLAAATAAASAQRASTAAGLSDRVAEAERTQAEAEARLLELQLEVNALRDEKGVLEENEKRRGQMLVALREEWAERVATADAKVADAHKAKAEAVLRARDRDVEAAALNDEIQVRAVLNNQF